MGESVLQLASGLHIYDLFSRNMVTSVACDAYTLAGAPAGWGSIDFVVVHEGRRAMSGWSLPSPSQQGPLDEP
jgi:hypothetical protein